MKTILNFLKVSFAFTALVLSTSSVQAQNALLVKENGTIVTHSDLGDRTESGANIVSDYTEGIAITQKGGKFGLVNKQGFELIMPQYDEIRPMQNGFAAVRQHNDWMFVNKQGQRLGSLRFDWAANFHNGLAAVQSEGKWSFINEQGFLIAPFQYDRVGNFEKGTAPVKLGHDWFYINERGEQLSIAEEWKLQQAQDSQMQAQL